MLSIRTTLEIHVEIVLHCSHTTLWMVSRYTPSDFCGYLSRNKSITWAYLKWDELDLQDAEPNVIFPMSIATTSQNVSLKTELGMFGNLKWDAILTTYRCAATLSTYCTIYTVKQYCLLPRHTFSVNWQMILSFSIPVPSEPIQCINESQQHPERSYEYRALLEFPTSRAYPSLKLQHLE